MSPASAGDSSLLQRHWEALPHLPAGQKLAVAAFVLWEPGLRREQAASFSRHGFRPTVRRGPPHTAHPTKPSASQPATSGSTVCRLQSWTRHHSGQQMEPFRDSVFHGPVHWLCLSVWMNGWRTDFLDSLVCGSDALGIPSWCPQ